MTQSRETGLPNSDKTFMRKSGAFELINWSSVTSARLKWEYLLSKQNAGMSDQQPRSFIPNERSFHCKTIRQLFALNVDIRSLPNLNNH